MVFFPNYELELYEYTSLDVCDAYGNPKKGYKYHSTVPCDFQPLSYTDSMEEFGKILEDTYKIYLNPNTPVNDKMVLRLKGYDDTYNIIGTPFQNNRFQITSHIRVVVQKTRQAIKLPTTEVEP